jgi:hypothetical protein
MNSPVDSESDDLVCSSVFFLTAYADHNHNHDPTKMRNICVYETLSNERPVQTRARPDKLRPHKSRAFTCLATVLTRGCAVDRELAVMPGNHTTDGLNILIFQRCTFH